VSVAEEWKMRCPQCNSDEFINISPSVWAKLLWARLFPNHSPDWHKSSAGCGACGFGGTVADFRIK
jgi:hypothetical protein